MKNIMSIDIGSRNLHVAIGGFDKNGLIANHTESFYLPKDSIEKEKVMDPLDLSDAILYALKACNYKGKKVIITVNAAEYVTIKELSLPKAKPRELNKIIYNEMVQVHNVDSTDVIQYKEIKDVWKEENGTLIRYQVASLPRDFVDGYRETIKNAKLNAIAMDININAIDKLFQWAEGFNGNPIEEEEATLLIDFGHSTTSVYICVKNQPLFYRHIGIGAGEIDRILLEKQLLTRDRIEFLKMHRDMVNKNTTNSENDSYENLSPHFNRLSDEIRKVLTFFRGRFRNTQINRGYIFGNGSELKGFSEFWDSNLNLPVEQLLSIKGTESQSMDINPAHVNAVAALIRH